MLNLEKFTESKTIIIPIVQGWGQYKGRKIYQPNLASSWYMVTLGNKIVIERKATQLEVHKVLRPRKKFGVFALGYEGIPMNFDVFKKNGWNEAVYVWFLNLPIFETASIIQWEDGRFYYYDQIQTQGRQIFRAVKAAFEAGTNLLSIKGITPELRYYFLLANLQRQTYEAIKTFETWTKSGSISEKEREKKITAFQTTFPVRLERTITQAGGKLITHSKKGNNYLVEWEVGGQKVKSTIQDNLQIISAGFCLSGDDKSHTLGSLVGLAQLFQHNGESSLYITRD